MVVGTASRGCQTAVIGAGPGGYLAAIRLAQLKKDVLLIDENPSLGGICLNEGCIPSKALIHVADFMDEVRRSHQFGVDISGVKLDLGKVMDWKNKIVRQLTGGVRQLTLKNGAEILTGRAKFISDRQLEVMTQNGPVMVEFEQAVIATGSVPVELPGFPVDGTRIIHSRHALDVATVPERLLIIGGGYIGLELGSVFRRFGSEVQIVEAGEELFPYADKEIRDVMKRRLKELEIPLYLNHRAAQFEGNDHLRVSVNGPDGQPIPMETNLVLLAAGRKPNTQNLGLESLKMKVDSRGFIEVSDRMETSIPGIYAIGDCIGGPLLAHKAYREAKVAAEVIAGSPAAFDNIVIPGVVYTDPEIAWAGLSEMQALKEGYQVVTGVFPFRASGRAMTLNATQGLVKTIADAQTKRILGIYIVGKGASELIAEAALAIEMNAFLDDLAQTIHPHPTMSEGILESVEAALGEAIHILNR